MLVYGTFHLFTLLHNPSGCEYVRAAQLQHNSCDSVGEGAIFGSIFIKRSNFQLC